MTCPTREVSTATPITAGTKSPATRSVSRWIGARLRWAADTSATIRASNVPCRTRSARITSAPLPFTVPPTTASRGPCSTGYRLPRHHRLVDRAAAFDHHAVDGDLLSRSHAQSITDGHALDRHVLVAAVFAHAARRLRSEAEQRADRPAGAAPRAQLEHLAEQHQRGDHRRRLEVQRRRPVVAADRSGDRRGKDHREEAVKEGRAGPDCDQREHVEPQRSQRDEGPLEERIPALDLHAADRFDHLRRRSGLRGIGCGVGFMAPSRGPRAEVGNSAGFAGRFCGPPWARTLSLSLLPSVSRMRAPDLSGALPPRFTAPNRPLTEAKRVRTLRFVRASRASRFGAKRQTES